MRVEYREEPCRTALNEVRGMPFRWSLNPYTGCAHRCAFCYVRAFEQRADRPADGRYGWSIRVKINVADVLRTELARRSWQRETVVLGAATDPYQPAEGRYRLTRRCMEVLSAASNPFGLITRGPLIVRDRDVLQEASKRAKVSVHLSVPTVDPDVWSRTEPGTAPPHQRLRAVRMLVDAGIDAGVAMAPILPGISDRPDQLEAVVRAARDAGATRLWGGAVYLRPGTREHFFETLARHWPEQLGEYQSMFRERAYLPTARTKAISDQVHELKQLHGIRDRRLHPLRPPPGPDQLELAV